MYENIKFNEYADKMLNQLQKGVFMTTKKGDKVNTMAIAWGSISFVWGKPIFMAFVRYTRDTYQMVEHANEFTINIPLDNDLRKKVCWEPSDLDYKLQTVLLPHEFCFVFYCM